MPVHDPEWSRRTFLRATGAGCLSLGLMGSRSAWADEPLEDTDSSGPSTYHNARLVLPSGEVIEGGIRIESGRIVEMGPGVRSGEDLDGAWISPGFVDAGCTVGLVEIGLEDSTRDDRIDGNAITPDARVWDGYNPASSIIPVTRVEGVTHVLVHPSPGRLVTGQAAIFRTNGDTVEQAREDLPPCLCINMGRSGMGSGGPSSRMDLSMQLREILEDAELPPEPRGGFWGRRSRVAPEEPEIIGDDAVWSAVRSGRLRTLIKAERADDILRALELTENYGLNTILLGAAEAHVVASEIAGAGIPVFLGPVTIQPSSFEHLRARYENAAVLHDAGVSISFRTGSSHDSRQLRVSAGIAVAHGLPWSAAMNALGPAVWSAFGVSTQNGLQEGAMAHLVISGGDPLQPRSPVLRVLIDGAETSMMTRQRRLYETFRVLGDRVR